MEDETKRKLKKVGRALLYIAEAQTEAIKLNAKSLSQDRDKSEEYRDKFAEMAENWGSVQNSLHGLRKSINSPETLSDFENDDEKIAIERYVQQFDQTPEYSQKFYNSEDLAQKQRNSATICSQSNDEIIEWEGRWQHLGKLKELKYKGLNLDGAGIVKLTVNGDVVYICRAIDVKTGGIAKKLDDLFFFDTKKRTTVYEEIGKNIEEVAVDVICVGSDSESIDISRKLEKVLINKYQPGWMKKTN